MMAAYVYETRWHLTCIIFVIMYNFYVQQKDVESERVETTYNNKAAYFIVILFMFF